MSKPDPWDVGDETDAENAEYHCRIGDCDMHAPNRRQVEKHAVRDHPFAELLSSVVERVETASVEHADENE